MRSAVDLIKRKSSSTLMDFHYVHLGQGMALPLFNSLGCIWRPWQPVFEQLSAQRRVDRTQPAEL
jgi:hypothetical protein